MFALRISGLVGLLAFGCNSLLDIEEPSPFLANSQPADAGKPTNGISNGQSDASGAAPDAEQPPAADANSAPSHAWADWPMPNPPLAGLPNPQSYDTKSFVGVVADLVTGLQWQATVTSDALSWSGAQAYCQSLSLAGGGWRLPSRIELLSIVDFTNTNPIIDGNAFPKTPAEPFWTASAFAGDAASAWIVNFGFIDGIADKSELHELRRVRCVR